MADDERSEYEIKIGGLAHTLLLTPEEAERAGYVKSKAAKLPQNKAVQSKPTK